jgi:hemerythrin-like domain-containing protein
MKTAKTGKKDATTKVKAKKSDNKKAHAKTAIDLLKEDHVAVKDLFREFRRLVKEQGDNREKRLLVRKACDMLIIHTRIEEELFYPVVRRALDEEELMNEALVEHSAAKDLIAQLKQMRPEDRMYDATFVVLSEMVKRHIREEEGKMFPKAKKSGIDLERLGQDLQQFKSELEEDMQSFYGEGQRIGQDRNIEFRPQVYASGRTTSYGLS